MQIHKPLGAAPYTSRGSINICTNEVSFSLLFHPSSRHNHQSVRQRNALRSISRTEVPRQMPNPPLLFSQTQSRFRSISLRHIRSGSLILQQTQHLLPLDPLRIPTIHIFQENPPGTVEFASDQNSPRSLQILDFFYRHGGQELDFLSCYVDAADNGEAFAGGEAGVEGLNKAAVVGAEIG